MIGKILGNRYELLEKIGEGGMSVVYKAQCHILNRIVAVKVLKEEYANNEEFLKKFKNEALSVAKLNHANIINVFDVGQDESTSYIVMEYVEGKNLKEVLKTQKKFSTPTMLDIARQIAMALEEAHQKGIVHRDIKAQNIMLSSRGVVKVGDFGIAKAVSNSTITASGAIMGSVHYFSPEQARGGYVDERSDLYSLGIIMYEMATGRLPFDGDSPVNIALKHIQDKLEFKDSDELSSDCKDMIIKLTQKLPDKRYVNARALIEDIDYLKNGKRNFVSNEEEDYATRMVKLPDRKKIQRYVEEEEEQEDYRPTHKKINEKNGNFSTFFAVFLGIIVVGAGALFLLKSSSFFVPKQEIVVIPEIVGRTEAEAKALLEEQGLQMNVRGSEKNNKYLPGQITDSDPDVGIKVQKGSIVHVILAEEQTETVLITDFKNRLLSEIEKQYAGKLKFKVEYIPSNEPTDTVIQQQPEEGTIVDVGSEVMLILSKNKNDIPIPVPNVLGKTLEEAKGLLSDFKVSESYKEDKNKLEGVVLSQNPSEGGMAKPKSTVSVVINKYEQPKVLSKRIAITLPQEKETMHVKVFKTSNGAVVYDKQVSSTEGDGVLVVNVEEKEGEVVNYTIEIDEEYYESVEISF
ncbi:Stk1 family PASTA domain-containing Ser/Thr kinase [Filifactor villosus]|uniref:non-specific serine/threonine protein kinase n=1 Tax=Filifactor villosus TaxID=29374 RepID=A0ABV9QMJ1_9FIRM